jgi:release factor glutamine methyltransferase
MPPDTIASLLRHARQSLEQAGVSSATLDSRLLLQDATGLNHASIIATSDMPVTPHQKNVFQSHIALRLTHQPVSKILGHREFFGRRFAVNGDVLDPRPDTETIVELCLAHLAPDQDFSFIDLGSGSGAIGITLACERPRSRGTCTDISDAALAVTRQNAIALGVGDRLTTLHSNWLTNVTGRFDLIVSNPPYIAHDGIPNLEPDVRDHDPHLALDGGHDGLDCYRAIAATSAPNLAPQGMIVIEIGAGQAIHITEIFRKQGFRLTDQKRDLGGHVRPLMFSTG